MAPSPRRYIMHRCGPSKTRMVSPTSTNASGETAMPFWSSEKRALSVIQSVLAYRDFTPTPIALSEFVKRWLPGLTRDDVYCGLNWSGKGAVCVLMEEETRTDRSRRVHIDR
ncbi:DUF2750 domain-containing protein [Rhizobium ruizarguesonis]